MKTRKRLLSLLLAAALLLTATALPGAAADAYPESGHDYRNNADETWEYVYPGEARQLYVTFSEETAFAASWVGYSYLEEGQITEEALREFAENGYYFPNDDDRLYIYDNTGALYGSYTGWELSGVTLCLPGDRFTLELVTDEAGTDYGFSIDRISTDLPESLALVNYRVDGAVYPVTAPAGEYITLDPAFMLTQHGDYMLTGWWTTGGRSWNYNADRWSWDGTETDLVAEPGATYNFYPVLCRIGMRAEEVYSFTNSDDVFDGGYYYTDNDYFRNIGNWMAAYGVTPFMPVAAAGLLVMAVYWPTLDFAGSCTGFPITELLQHYGKIDLLSAQGASSLSELEPTEELLSKINVYNNNAVACHLVNNVAIDPGSEGYTAQLKKLYATLAEGTPVYFEFYPGGEHPMKIIATGDVEAAKSFWDATGAHGILLTGAYTAADGSHVLIACDCNSTNYVNGGCDVVTINADFTEIEYGGTLYGFSWNDDMSQFDSFRLEGVSNPLAWHIAFFRHIVDTLKQIFALLAAGGRNWTSLATDE